MTKAMTIKKLQRVETTDKSDIKKGIVAFQVVIFTINYFGSKTVCEHDTEIMKDGRQLVIGGDGFIKHGMDISNL